MKSAPIISGQIERLPLNARRSERWASLAIEESVSTGSMKGSHRTQHCEHDSGLTTVRRGDKS